VTLRRPAALAISAGRLAAGHRLFLCLLAAAAALRVIVQVAYRPALFFYGDSFAYLANASHLRPESVRPAGYPALLRALLVIHDLAVVPAVQHILGLLTGTLVYALVRRLGVGPVGACVAAAPVLFDAYQLNIEQHILSETLFTLVIVAALAILLWHSRPSFAACVATGALLAVAALTRSVGLALIAPALLFVIVRGGLVRTLVLGAAFALPLAGYAAWYSVAVPHGTFTLTDHDGYFLYGRVADFASCDGLHIGRAERRVLCDPRPPSERPNPNYYVWHQWARKRYPGFPRLPVRRNAVLESFALGVIHHQPVAYIRTVLHDMEHYAAFGRSTGRHDEPVSEWQFPRAGRRQTARQVARLQLEVRTWGGSVGGSPPLQRALRAYQRVVYTPGPLLLLAVILALAGAVLGTVTGAGRQVRAEMLTLAAAGVLIPLVAAMTSMFDYRYLLPALPLLPAAGVLGATVLHARVRALRTAQPDPVSS
jgi:hypothetical protein